MSVSGTFMLIFWVATEKLRVAPFVMKIGLMTKRPKLFVRILDLKLDLSNATLHLDHKQKLML